MTSSSQILAGGAIQQQSSLNCLTLKLEKTVVSQAHERLMMTGFALCLKNKAEPMYFFVGVTVEMTGMLTWQPDLPGKVVQLEFPQGERRRKSRSF